jgi:hypothetical protein
VELDVEHILNWSEHLFNPSGWRHVHPKLWLPGMDEGDFSPPPRYQAQNASFTERYGAGIRSARTILLSSRQTGRSMMTAEAMALLQRVFGPREEARPLPPSPPAATLRQERNRRRFLRG